MNSQDAATQVLRLIAAEVPKLRSEPNALAKSFAAAGLMRSCALLRGMLVLDSAGLSELTGILARQHWETWLVSLYALLGGEDAIRAVAADNVYWRRKLENSLKLEPGHQSKWPGTVVKLNYRALSDCVLKLLEDRGEPTAGPVPGVTGYDITYSFQSTMSLHANVSTITPHIAYGPDAWSVTADAPPPLSDQLLTPVLHTVHLAQYAFKEFGLAADALEAVATELIGSQSSPKPGGV